jgi:CubicO group peptidase (beta-lactamase class C family)
MRQYFFIVSVLTAFACDVILLSEQDRPINIDENLATPASTGDGWEVSSLASEGIDAAPIEKLVTRIQSESWNLHSFLIVKNNKLVLDAYFAGWHRDRIHDMRSATKSVNAMLVGIAIDNGFIKDVNQPIIDFFPEYRHLFNESKKEIQIQHLLTMTAGLAWDQSGQPGRVNDETTMEGSREWLGYVLQKEMQYRPGERFVYSSGCSNLLAGTIKASTGDNANVFAEMYLFEPLNITKYFWRQRDDGLCNAGAGLLLRPRDMAKIGQLVLDSGMWKGKEVVSRNWIKVATTPTEASKKEYGYQWWVTTMTVKERPLRVVLAAGNGGQYIFIVPELQLVVVFTGGNYAPLNQNQPHAFMRMIILPSML